MFTTIVRAGAVGAGAASRYVSGSGSNQMMRLLVVPAPQHCFFEIFYYYNREETLTFK
jgi:hypothetical protein